MAQEIERKFLVSGDFKSFAFAQSRIMQGYICSARGRTVRVRIRDDKGYLTIKGASRINMYDAGIYYQNNRFHIEAEYLYKMYGHEAFKDVHAVNSFVNYDLPLKKVFNKISFLARYDMMTDHSNGLADSETGVLKINDYARHRVTGGITLSLSKAFIADLRLNFEKYFYQKSGVPKESERDKIVIEFMTRF